MNNANQLLRTEGICKQFGSVLALSPLDFALAVGEVRALVGENGAGKSTLVRILTGAIQPSAGRMWVRSEPVQFERPKDAEQQGIGAVHQEVPLLELRSVAENVYFGQEPCRFGFIQRRRMLEGTRAALNQLGTDIDPGATVRNLNAAQRQMVSLARSLVLGAKLLVLDEPTSSLSTLEVAVFLGVVRRLQARGVGIILVSHRFDELYAVCDSVTVLRDGRLVRTDLLKNFDRTGLISLMLGREREEVREHVTAFSSRPRPSLDGPALLEVERVSRNPDIENVSISVRRNEIVGLAGLLGSGRTETARAVFGADRYESGRVLMNGSLVPPHSPRAAIRRGMGFVGEDRKLDGIIPEMSVAENLTLAALPSLSRAGFISQRRHRAIVSQFIDQLRIKAATPRQKVRELSGGNQQKVLLARWLCRGTKVLVLDDPTRGVDVGGRADIQRLIRRLVDAGAGVLLISSEMDEIVEASSRVLVLRDGRVVAELAGHAVSHQAIVHAMADEP